MKGADCGHAIQLRDCGGGRLQGAEHIAGLKHPVSLGVLHEAAVVQQIGWFAQRRCGFQVGGCGDQHTPDGRDPPHDQILTRPGPDAEGEIDSFADNV